LTPKGQSYALESSIHSYFARGSCRSGGSQSSFAVAGRLRSPSGGGSLRLSLPGAENLPQGDANHSRGDERHRGAGVLFAGFESGGALERVRPVPVLRGDFVQAHGPQPARNVSGSDTRRGNDEHRPQRAAVVQATASDLVSDPGEIPRRAAAQVGVVTAASVLDEGLLFLRP